MNSIREDALYIADEAIKAVLPENAVVSALQSKKFEGNVVLVAIGKAAWRMAAAAKEVLGDRISRGVVITKYQHSLGKIKGLEVYEAGHPVPDENTLKATEIALELVKNLSEKDTVLFLVSGGGSALFESLREGVTLDDLADITQKLLNSGANIVEINTVRKHLSKVKGGGFARLVQPAKVFSLVLSDVLGDRLDSIASEALAKYVKLLSKRQKSSGTKRQFSQQPSIARLRRRVLSSRQLQGKYPTSIQLSRGLVP